MLQLKYRRVLLLIALCGIFPCHGLAQEDIDFSVSPLLASPLTDNPQAALTTTLAIDLLAPQRPFIYDATGASLLANALNPEVNSTDLSSAAGFTDTAVRDSSQSGQFNPFAPGGSRLGLLLSAGGGTSASANPLSSPGLSPSLSETNLYGAGTQVGNAPEGSIQTDSYQSSWGASSSFGVKSAGLPTSGSTWENAKIPVPRMGQTMATGEGSFSSGSESVSSVVASSSAGSRRPDRASLRSMDRASRRTGETSTGAERIGPGTRTQDAQVSCVGSIRTGAGMPRYPASAAETRVASTGGNAPPNSQETPLQFSPRSYNGYSLGASPFSSPGEDGELSFLNPNILNVSPIVISSSDRQRTQSPQRTQPGQTLDETGRLAFSGTNYGLPAHYGLSTHSTDLDSTDSGLGASRRRKTGKNPFLTDNTPDRQ